MNAQMQSEALDAAIGRVLTEMTRTDSKAGLILTLDSILVAGLVAMAARLPRAAWPAVALGALALVVSATLAILVMRPRLGGGDRGSFVYWATLTSDEALLAALANDRRPAHLRVMSRICMAKMRMLRRAADTALAAVVLLAASAVLTAVS